MKTVTPIRSDSGFDIGPDMFAKDPEQRNILQRFTE